VQPAPVLSDTQREILARALSDAIAYREEPPDCADCDKAGKPCDDHAAELEQGRAYRALGRELAIRVDM
jgi:hypothetical protein